MEEAEFADARDDALHLEKDYDDVWLRQLSEAAKKMRAATLRQTRSRGTQFILPHFGREAM
jgi:hypothetical protein